MVEQDTTRFDRLRKLCPRRFYISENPPFGVGLVLCCHVNEEDDEEGQQFFTQHDGIRNCKPGIWTSMRKPVTNVSQGDQGSEYILRWVGPGTIDISQPVEEWEAYEKATREADAAVKLSQIVPKGTKWRRAGSYFSDDGVCAIISTEYLTKEASETIMGEEAGTMDYGSYLELLTLNGTEAWETPENAGFTIGGVDFGQDEVGGPPRVAVAEEDGKVIAVRLHEGGEEYDGNDSDGSEEGFSSGEDTEESQDDG